MNTFFLQVARALQGLPVASPIKRQEGLTRPHLHVKVRPLDASRKGYTTSATASAQAQLVGSPGGLHLDREAADTELFYEGQAPKAMEADVQEGQSA